jgi:hypothetical protein
MEFSDFAREFNRLYVLRVLSDDIGIKWLKTVHNGEWTQQTSGGCLNYPTWNVNPQYKLIADSDSRVFVSLRQPDIRSSSAATKKKFPAIGLMIMTAGAIDDDYRKSQHTSSDTVAITNFMAAREASVEFYAKKGQKYVVIPANFEPGTLNKFQMTVFSTEKITVSPLSKEQPSLQAASKWSKASGTAGGCPNNSTWRQNPQFSLSLTKPTKVNVVLEQPSVKPEAALHAGYYILKADNSAPTQKLLDITDAVVKPQFINTPQSSLHQHSFVLRA